MLAQQQKPIKQRIPVQAVPKTLKHPQRVALSGNGHFSKPARDGVSKPPQARKASFGNSKKIHEQQRKPTSIGIPVQAVPKILKHPQRVALSGNGHFSEPARDWVNKPPQARKALFGNSKKIHEQQRKPTSIGIPVQ